MNQKICEQFDEWYVNWLEDIDNFGYADIESCFQQGSGWWRVELRAANSASDASKGTKVGACTPPSDSENAPANLR